MTNTNRAKPVQPDLFFAPIELNLFNSILFVLQSRVEPAQLDVIFAKVEVCRISYVFIFQSWCFTVSTCFFNPINRIELFREKVFNFALRNSTQVDRAIKTEQVAMNDLLR